MSDLPPFAQTRWQREVRDRDPHDHQVYIIGRASASWCMTGPVKIGISQNALSRLQQLQTGSHDRLFLCGQFNFWKRRHAEIVERSFHDGMDHCRLEGEWFDLKPQDAIGAMTMVLEAFIKEYLQPDDMGDFYMASEYLGVPGFLMTEEAEFRFPS